MIGACAMIPSVNGGRTTACEGSPRQPYESEGEDQDRQGCENDVCPRSPLAQRSLLGKMAGVYSHDDSRARRNKNVAGKSRDGSTISQPGSRPSERYP